MFNLYSKNVINYKSFLLLKKYSGYHGYNVRKVSQMTFDVKNPANGQVINAVTNMTVEEVEKVVKKSHTAFQQHWQHTTAKHRGTLLRKWFNLLEKNAGDIAKTLSKESGKPITEAKGEVTYGNTFVEWFSEDARFVLGQIIPSPIPSKKILVEKHPIGVVGIITPWNFPHAMISRKVAPALAAGCTCVIKPAPETPLTAIKLVELAHEAGIPEDVVAVVTSRNCPGIGDFFCSSPLVTGISFTGSTRVGKLLYKNCSEHLKRICLELGGNASFIVFDSADVDKAIDGALVAKFRNCGQACVAANRFLIQDKVHDEFLEKLTEKIKNLKMGDGARSDVQIGPLIKKQQVETVSNYVKDAVDKGAKVLLGGKVAEDVGELFYKPTILTNVTSEMRLYNEEVFGPVVPIIKFKEEEEAVKIANSTKCGLANYFYSQDVKQIFRVSKLLESGMVGINEGLISMVEAPFGGIKESGIGREGSIYGIDEFVYIKYYCLGGLD